MPVLRRRPRSAGAVRRASVRRTVSRRSPDDRCEVVLYTPRARRDASPRSAPIGARRVVDLWAERSAALRAAGRRSTCSCSRTGAPRSGRRSLIRTARSTRTTPSRAAPHRLLDRRPAPRGGHPVSAWCWPMRGWRVGRERRWPSTRSRRRSLPTRRSPTSSLPTTTTRRTSPRRSSTSFAPARPALRSPAALHDVAPPGTDGVGRRHVTAVQHRDRVAVAIGRRAAASSPRRRSACEVYFNPVDPADVATRLRSLA